MILFDLRCRDGHRFEAWFRDGAGYDAQAAAGEVACSVCGDTDITKAPMAPRIAKGRRGDPSAGRGSEPTAGGDGAPAATDAVRRLAEMRRHIQDNCDYVGDRFADEARSIHYGDCERRDIYGEATDAQANELADEGVEFSRIPWPVRTDS